jgi:hypothetical protein
VKQPQVSQQIWALGMKVLLPCLVNQIRQMKVQRVGAHQFLVFKLI